MAIVEYIRPGLLCRECGEPFTLSFARPDAVTIEDLIDPFQARCPECESESVYQKCDIRLMIPVNGP
jgi:Zn finger protein HypA/HybF involved in hydrogenase expression